MDLELAGKSALITGGSRGIGRAIARALLAEDVATPDILVNNAGAIRAGRLDELSIDDLRGDWELKVFGYFPLCQLLQPRMAARGSGTILNVIGMAGRANRAAYISGWAANAALIALTQSPGAEAQGQGLRVLGIDPAPMVTDRMTDFMKRQALSELGDPGRWREVVQPDRFPYGRPAEPEEVAALALMLMSPRAGYLNSTVVDIDGGGQWIG